MFNGALVFASAVFVDDLDLVSTVGSSAVGFVEALVSALISGSSAAGFVDDFVFVSASNSFGFALLLFNFDCWIPPVIPPLE